MSDFQYRVSVIVPIYNVEKYVEECILSLLNQNIDLSEMEILLINDGSTDSSEEICKKYSDDNDNIKLFSKENEGLSKTRNFGLAKASGKYILYLDSDDKLSKETVKNVVDFFDTVYDEVDLVTYRIIQYYQGRPTVTHFRYKTMTHTGVYDLNESKNRFITQTNINICVKNKFEKNITFDTTPDFRHEDEKYCCQVLMEKMKIGFCADAEYLYNRNNADSIVSTQFLPENIFESSMRFYESLFSLYKFRVPPYFQGIVFNDFRWKLMDDKFLPTHLQAEEREAAERRIDAILKRIDEDTIILHPSINEYHMHYWLKRRDKSLFAVVAEQEFVCVYYSGIRIYKASYFKSKIKNNQNNCATVSIDSPIFDYIDSSRYCVRAGDKKIEKISLSPFSIPKTTAQTNNLLTFDVECVDDLIPKMSIVIDSYEYKVK